jgi:hypothetical protein
MKMKNVISTTHMSETQSENVFKNSKPPPTTHL